HAGRGRPPPWSPRIWDRCPVDRPGGGIRRPANPRLGYVPVRTARSFAGPAPPASGAVGSRAVPARPRLSATKRERLQTATPATIGSPPLRCAQDERAPADNG